MGLRDKVKFLEKQISLSNRLESLERRISYLEMGQRAIAKEIGVEIVTDQPLVLRRKGEKKL